MPYLRLSDASIYYEVHGGQGQLVILVHGAMCSHRDWENQVRSLSASCTVVTLDLRGHGLSAASFETCAIERFAADVNALIKELGLGPAVLAGHSLAARVVIEAARQCQQNVSGLVLVDGSRLYAGEQVSAGDPARLTDQEVNARIADLIEAAIGSYADAAAADHVRTTMSSAPIGLRRAYLATSQHWDAHSFEEALEHLAPDLPVLAIQSTSVGYGFRRCSLSADATTTPYLEELKRHLRRLRVVVLPEVGHFSMLEAAARVSSLIWDFAKENGRSAVARPTHSASPSPGLECGTLTPGYSYEI
jgi:pimeloyl-ACP methyl ester carboxylesterase